MNIYQPQKRFFVRIKESLPSSISFVHEVSDLLQVSIDSAYRRIRGEKLLDFKEIELVCGHFGVQPVELLQGGKLNAVNFDYYPHITSLEEFKAYILNIRNEISQIKPSGELSLHISAADLPLFIHFRFNELTKFKFFYWLKYVIGDDQFANQELDFSLIDEELIEATNQIYQAYLKIPSVEIWSDETLASTIKQWEFFWESGSFETKEQAKLILDQSMQLLKNVKMMANKSSKQIEGNIDTTTNNYKLYYSDVTIGNNCILLDTEHFSEVYLSHYTYKSIKTKDVEFVRDTKEWLNIFIKKSMVISGSGEKQRFQFFKILEKKIEKLYGKLDEF